jgi:hypothetical protein
MNRRVEPRFPVDLPAHVTILGNILGNPDRELACQLIEWSANGMKLLSPEKLLEDVIIGLDLEFHVVLAVIRHWHPLGERYAIGAERIHVIDKDALRQGEPTGDQMRAILAERGWSLLSEISPVMDPPSSSRSWRLPMALAASLAIAALAVVYFLQFPAGTAKAHSLAVPAAAVEAAIPPPAPEPFPPNAPRPARRVQIKALSTTWVAVTADGKDILARLLTEGDTKQIDFSKVAHVRVGAAGGVEIHFNGKPLGSLGRPGQLRLIEFTPEEFRFLPWTDTDQ